MIENARSQLLLVLLALVAGLMCMFFTAQWGQDLKGGNQLRYEISKDVLDQLTQKGGTTIDQIMDQSIAVIRDRIDPTGTIDPAISRSGETGILIELPWSEDPQDLKRTMERIANLGRLEMRMVADADYQAPATDTSPAVSFNMQAEVGRLNNWLKLPGNKELLLKDPLQIRLFNNDPAMGPIQFGKLAWYPHIINPSIQYQNPQMWDHVLANGQNSASTVKLFEDKDYNNGLVPDEIKKKPLKEQTLLEYVAINMHEISFSGEDLDSSGVSASHDRNGRLSVAYKINGDRSDEYADWSQRYLKKCSAIILNGVIKSAPAFQSRIPGNGEITGDFSKEEVDELVKVLRTGSLRILPELVSKVEIGPTLGAEAIWRGSVSLVAGSALVFAFMLWYYRLVGVIACITLVLNMFLLWASMLFMQATLTLPGLGGIVLTMGMAVDANVLIYERIREELTKGKDMVRAVRAGFERAMAAILDSNITTFLVGLVLFNVGVGPVRGFAVTLMAGIVTTIFTQFFVTRLLCHYALESKKLDNYKPRELLQGVNLDFVKLIKTCILGSAAVIVAGLVFAFAFVPREVMLGMDFTGGATLRMVLKQPTTADAVRTLVTKEGDPFTVAYPNVDVNTVEAAKDETSRQFNLRLKLTDAQRDEIEQGRKAWRTLRSAADKAGTQPPPEYEPPYLVELHRIFKDQLVDQAFVNPTTIPNPEAGSTLQFAQIELNFQQPIKVADAQQLVATNKLTNGHVSVPGDPNAATGQHLRIEWQVQGDVRPWHLFELASKSLEGLKGADGSKVILSDPFPYAQEVQGRLVNDLRNAAISALVLSWGLIVLYLRVRFHEYKYGLAAVVALIHDVLITFGVVVFANKMNWVHAEINVAMIACFLTIIGYSVNDTIIIFDRIRENLQETRKQGIVEPFRALINRSLNQTMSRTLLTSGVTMFVVLAQFFVNWGSDSDLESFAFAMIVGIVTGTYSSIYIAAPILIYFHKDEPLPMTPATVTADAAPTESAQ